MAHLTLAPAYGRDYKSKAEVLADFEANRDFVLLSFSGETYINKEQISPGQSVNFRYGKMRKVFVHTVKK